MARPRKNNADYFPHDVTMRHDRRVKAVIEKFKHVGYSIYNMLLESIAGSPDFKLPYGGFEPELIAADLKIELLPFTEIVDYLLSIQLIQKNGDFLVCKELENRLSSLIRKREREREEVIADDNTQSKVKETKGKDILISNLEIYKKNNPDKKISQTIQEDFINYWGATIQNGKKENIGKARWEAEITFDIAGRIATFIKNSKEPKTTGSSPKTFKSDLNLKK